MRELYPLRFTAGQGQRGLSEFDITESNRKERLHFAGDLWHGRKKFGGFFDRHLKHIGDIFPLVPHVEGFPRRRPDSARSGRPAH